MQKLILYHTSIKSLFAPSEMVARLSYFSGSKLFRAAVRYSPAGVVLTFSPPDFIKATVPSLFSLARGRELTSTERPRLLLSLLVTYNKDRGIGYKIDKGTRNTPKKKKAL